MISIANNHRLGCLGLLLTLSLIILAILAPWLTSYDPLEMVATDRFQPPSLTHLLGTDEFGRDLWSRILIGTRLSLSVAFISTCLATSMGVCLGLIAGYAGGWFDTVSMRLMDVILAFPAILLAIIILAIAGPSSINAMIAVAIVNIPAFARLTRAAVLVEKNKEYVESARAIGTSHLRIILKTLLPNILSIILVHITITMAGAVLLESALSFLGLGTPPPAPSWGSMLSTGQNYMYMAPWYGIFPGLAITLLVLGLYLLGDGLRDVLDPHKHQSSIL